MNKYDYILKKIYIFDKNYKNISQKDVAIQNGNIVRVEKKISSLFTRKINCNNKIAMPGFINAHIHFGEYYVKGYSEKYNTNDYINYTEKFNRLNESIKEEIRVSSTRLCVYEAVDYGQTSLVGIRGWNSINKPRARMFFGYPLMKSHKLGEYIDNFDEKYSQIKMLDIDDKYIFIHSLISVDEQILEMCSKICKNKNIKIAIHLLETKSEREIVERKYGLGPLEVLEKYNLLSKNTLLVHCCYINDNDIKIIRDNNCTICLCPTSNLKLLNKVPTINKLSGINICLGTDGVATNDSLNILNTCKILALLQNISDAELIRMITVNPGMFLNNKTGMIKAGFKADICTYDLNNYKIVNKDKLINNLIFSSDIKPDNVIVNGKFIVKKKKNKLFNPNKQKIKKKIKYN